MPITMNQRIALGTLILLLIAGALLLARQSSELPAKVVKYVETDAIGGKSTKKEYRRDDKQEITAASTDLPLKYRFGRNTRIPKSENDNLLLSNYSQEEQTIIRAFYAGFGGTGLKGINVFDNVFSFKNQEQLTWLANNGYPLPDDILMAARMPTAELHALATEGSFKAKAMLLAREYQTQADSGSNISASTRDEYAKYKELAAFREDVLSDGSPFAGYVWAAEHMNKPDSSGRAGVLAGYAFAATLGDTRADLLAGHFSKAHPGMNPVEALASYKTILSIASKNPQLANTSTLMKRQKFEMF